LQPRPAHISIYSYISIRLYMGAKLYHTIWARVNAYMIDFLNRAD
jgi:hypothetical protein